MRKEIFSPDFQHLIAGFLDLSVSEVCELIQKVEIDSVSEISYPENISIIRSYFALRMEGHTKDYAFDSLRQRYGQRYVEAENDFKLIRKEYHLQIV